MKILVYTGYHHSPFSWSDWTRTGSGGVMTQTLQLAQSFAQNGHSVTISGQVAPETAGEIRFLPTETLAAGTHYDLVIGLSYIHYMRELEARGVTWDKSIFWVHLNDHFPWWRGDRLPENGAAEFHDPRMTWVVAQSPAHARTYRKNNPGASKKLRVIGNAIDVAAWTALSVEKQPGRFVFTSSNAKALDRLLAIWPRIRAIEPGASLHVARPATGEAHPEIASQEGVTDLGPLPLDALRKEILAAEYWLNPSTYLEEYGLSALQMMMARVKVISTGHGNLADLLQGRATAINDAQTEIEAAALAAFETCRAHPADTSDALDRARAFAEAQSWEARIGEWMALIGETPRPQYKYPELFTYFEDPRAWEERFISYAARTKEWDLVVDEPFDNCFSFPLFTEEFCRKVREEAEHADSWTTDRHAFYPTTDLLLQVIGLNDIYKEVIANYIIPCAKALWVLPDSWDKNHAETFLAKYTAKAQGHLSLHHDASDITCLIQLSDLTEYEGGGTYFVRQKKLVKNDIGYASLHPGNITHRHGGRAISKGLRYIIVSFITRNR